MVRKMSFIRFGSLGKITMFRLNYRYFFRVKTAKELKSCPKKKFYALSLCGGRPLIRKEIMARNKVLHQMDGALNINQ